jgi:DNA repair photolyase
MGTNTDPYQRCEGKYHLTRGIIEVLSAARNPFSILTKSTLVLRDAELLVEASKRTDVSLMFSVGTLDEDVWRATEPGTPAPWKRLEAITRLREAGIPCGVLMAPLLPGLSDDAAGIRAVVGAARAAGASHVSGGPLLYLTPPVRAVFMKRLAVSHPHLVERYERLYQGVRAPAAEQARVRAIVDDALGRRTVVARPAPFRRPQPPPAPVPAPAEQLRLGM